MVTKLMQKIVKNSENQNREINKLTERNKILEEMIKKNNKSIQELYNHFMI